MWQWRTLVRRQKIGGYAPRCKFYRQRNSLVFLPVQSILWLYILGTVNPLGSAGRQRVTVFNNKSKALLDSSLNLKLIKLFSRFFCGCSSYVSDSLWLFTHRNGELWMQKLKSHLLRTQSLKDLPLKPGVGQYLATRTSLTARDSFLASFYSSGPFTSIFSRASLEFFLF